jgi:hypothetical protein
MALLLAQDEFNVMILCIHFYSIQSPHLLFIYILTSVQQRSLTAVYFAILRQPHKTDLVLLRQVWN